MTQNRQEQIRIALVQLRETHQASIASLHKSIQDRTSECRAVGDLVDGVQRSSETSMESERASHHHDIVVQINEALRDLHLGIHGKCRQCSAEISLARLNAVPFARYCLDCQDRAERAQQHSPLSASLSA